MESVQRSDVSCVVEGQVENQKWILFIAAAVDGGSNAFAHLQWSDSGSW